MAKQVKRKGSASSEPARAQAVEEKPSATEEDMFEENDSDNSEIDGLNLSSDDGQSDEEDEQDEALLEEVADEIEEAVLEYMGANAEEGGEIEEEGKLKLANEEVENDENDEDVERISNAVEESDSSEDERPSRNTVGDVPLKWYKDEPHIGYTKDGKKIIKKEKKDKLDAFLDKMDNSDEWRKVYDEYNDEEVLLTKDEIKMIQRIREGKIPHAKVNPYEPYVDWFDWEDAGHPLSSAPEPKRRFIPSKWEAKMVVKLVRALRKGWIQLDKPPPEKPKVYLLWKDDLKAEAEKTANGLAYIPAPKPKLPGHEESYNPPVEYVPTEEEVKGYELLYEEDRPQFIPTKYDSLRKVPAYKEFIRERFERCLDLYLCPRARKKRINIDPESLIPKLPKPKSLKPFPTTLSLEFRGHTGPVGSISTDPSGQWLASGSDDGTVRIWEVDTGRCRKVWHMPGGSRVRHVAWNPAVHLSILAVAFESNVLLLPVDSGSEEKTKAGAEILAAKGLGASSGLVTWGAHTETQGLLVTHQHAVQSVSWHHKGDYFASLAPDGNTRAVLVHQLTKQTSQNPFKRSHGRVERVLFHPVRPFLFVATRTHVRCYNLAQQQLAKKLTAGVKQISSMAIHPQGDNVVVGSQDMRVVWFDMDLSTKPYKTLRNHSSDVTSVEFHRSYPLFASTSDDGTTQIFHGMVYSDLMQNPLLVPVKVLRGHSVVNQRGVLDCAFHPKQPWIFTSGEDSLIFLYCH